MTHPLTHPLDLVEALLADLGILHRRAGNETLTPDDFRTLTRRMRDNLRALRQQLEDEEGGNLVLTDVASALVRAEEMKRTLKARPGQSLGLASLLSRVPGLMRGSDLGRDGRPHDLSRGLRVIDGGRT
ncbi:hypothetical protein [Brevundimonas sp.]|uniref:hypothetical protein n=1 Tax=Brevundimonas sp. TaxID=1871086 RepID=UPI003514BDBA